MTETNPAKPIPKPSQSLIELPKDSGAIFHAVGILPGDVALSVQGASKRSKGKKKPRYLGNKTPC